MSKLDPQIAEFMRGVKVAAEYVDAAICNLGAVLISGDVPNGLWGVAENVETILELANIDVQSAVEDFLHDAEMLEADESTKVAA
jgi:hypothetical protein